MADLTECSALLKSDKEFSNICIFNFLKKDTVTSLIAIIYVQEVKITYDKNMWFIPTPTWIAELCCVGKNPAAGACWKNDEFGWTAVLEGN